MRKRYDVQSAIREATSCTTHTHTHTRRCALTLCTRPFVVFLWSCSRDANPDMRSQASQSGFQIPRTEPASGTRWSRVRCAITYCRRQHTQSPGAITLTFRGRDHPIPPHKVSPGLSSVRDTRINARAVSHLLSERGETDVPVARLGLLASLIGHTKLFHVRSSIVSSLRPIRCDLHRASIHRHHRPCMQQVYSLMHFRSSIHTSGKVRSVCKLGGVDGPVKAARCLLLDPVHPGS